MKQAYIYQLVYIESEYQKNLQYALSYLKESHQQISIRLELKKESKQSKVRFLSPFGLYTFMHEH